MGTLRTQQVASLIKRVWHDPTGTFERGLDPTLGDWGRTQVAAAPFTEHDDVAAAGLVDDAGVVLADPIELTADPDGVRISYRLAPGERLYGAYDADARSLQRRGDHVHLVTELHPLTGHRMAGDCDLCGAAADELRLQISDVGSNYGELIVPFFVSSRGYGVYVANLTSGAVLDLGQRDGDRWTFTASGGHADVYLFGPAPMPELVRQFTRLTGHQPLPPAWTLGYLQSRFGYESFDHALAVLDRFREEQLPVHGLVLDVQWLEQYVNLRFDPESFPDPRGNLARIADHGTRVVVITEPGTRVDSSNFEPGRARPDTFAETADGELFDSDQWYTKRGIEGLDFLPAVAGALVNFFNEDAADWWYDQHVPLLDMGVDAWWIDLNEPEDVTEDVTFPATDWPRQAERLDGREVRNVFALAQQRAFARRDRTRTDRRPFALSRSGAAGSQRYGASPWSGDIGATWADMQRQVRLMLTAGICGIPMWGCDVGGFSGDPGPELFARWLQMGAFLPVFRAHGMMRDREPWSQGPEALEAARAALVLRAQLLPSLVTWTYEAMRDGMPLARPMLFEDPADERWHDCHDQWMLGPLLVAPVLEEGATGRVVQLPRGSWVDVWSGSKVGGDGGEVEVSVGLGTVPLLAPAGTLLVADPEPLAGRGRAWPPGELEVWQVGGEDVTGGGTPATTLYVDDGITRMHEQGAYCYERIEVAGGEIAATRISGGWPSPRLRLTAPHPGRPLEIGVPRGS